MKPGLKRTVGGALLMIVGFILIPVAMVLQAMKQVSADQQQFLMPGTAEVRVDEPGRYYLWNEYQTTYLGATYHQSSNLPHGLRITVEDEQETLLDLKSGATISVNNLNGSRNSVAYVEVETPGTYVVRVEGMEEQRVFSWSPLEPMEMVMSFVVCLLLIIVTTMVGGGIAAWGVVRMCSKKKRAAEAA